MAQTDAPRPAWMIDPDFAPSPTVTIDDVSDPGAWATHIAHTPHLARQVVVETGDGAKS